MFAYLAPTGGAGTGTGLLSRVSCIGALGGPPIMQAPLSSRESGFGDRGGVVRRGDNLRRGRLGCPGAPGLGGRRRSARRALGARLAVRVVGHRVPPGKPRPDAGAVS
jgi:hypothetical protein